jgi:acid phosphatase (class A)
MDTIKYPPVEYGGSLTWLLVKPYYLKDEEVKTISASVAFPANSSDQTRKELDYLLELQSKRSVEQKTRVEFLANIGYWPQINLVTNHPQYKTNLDDLYFIGREVLGQGCIPAGHPNITKLLQGVMQDMRIMEFTVKYRFLRPRPYHLEPKLEPMAKINSPSFASGHTLWAFIQAYIWSEIIPEKRSEFIKLAEEVRRSREIMGIHFPSDNEAARQISHQMLQAYFENERFKKDLAAAQKEWNENLRKSN